MILKQKIFEDLKAAMKSGDVFKKDVLRMLDSAIKNVEIEKKKREEGLSDAEIQEVVSRSIKQRKDATSQYRSGGRDDLAEKEEKEVEVLSVYLPEQMSEEEIRKVVKETLGELGVSQKSEAGKAMGVLMGKLKGRADGNFVRKILEEEVS